MGSFLSFPADIAFPFPHLTVLRLNNCLQKTCRAGRGSTSPVVYPEPATSRGGIGNSLTPSQLHPFAVWCFSPDPNRAIRFAILLGWCHTTVGILDHVHETTCWPLSRETRRTCVKRESLVICTHPRVNYLALFVARQRSNWSPQQWISSASRELDLELCGKIPMRPL